MIYKILETQFTYKNFSYNQIKREGDVAIYSQTKKDWKILYYEVIIIQRHNGYTIAGNYIEPAETYPSSSAWGINGWTYTNLKDAEEKFNQLLKK